MDQYKDLTKNEWKGTTSKEKMWKIKAWITIALLQSTVCNITPFQIVLQLQTMSLSIKHHTNQLKSYPITVQCSKILNIHLINTFRLTH